MPVKKIILATVLGGLTLFLWGALSHTLIPFSKDALLGFNNEDAVTQAILAGAPKSGVYFMPYIVQRSEKMTEQQLKAAKQAAEEKMQRGPFMLASIRLGEMGSFGNYLVIQFITDMISVLFVCLVLIKAKEISFKDRVASTVFIGLAGFAATSLPQWNWYAFSLAFTLAELFDIVVGFFLAGLVIAKVLPAPQGTA